MKYKSTKAPKDKPIWACTYSEKTTCDIKKPVYGMIIGSQFFEFEKNNIDLRKCGVSIYAREYADTYEECVELYNSLIMKEIEFLNVLIEDCKDDLIN